MQETDQIDEPIIHSLSVISHRIAQIAKFDFEVNKYVNKLKLNSAAKYVDSRANVRELSEPQ